MQGNYKHSKAGCKKIPIKKWKFKFNRKKIKIYIMNNIVNILKMIIIRKLKMWGLIVMEIIQWINRLVMKYAMKFWVLWIMSEVVITNKVLWNSKVNTIIKCIGPVFYLLLTVFVGLKVLNEGLFETVQGYLFTWDFYNCLIIFENQADLYNIIHLGHEINNSTYNSISLLCLVRSSLKTKTNTNKNRLRGTKITTKNYCSMFKNKIKNYCSMFTDKLNWVRLMDNVKLNWIAIFNSMISSMKNVKNIINKMFMYCDLKLWELFMTWNNNIGQIRLWSFIGYLIFFIFIGVLKCFTGVIYCDHSPISDNIPLPVNEPDHSPVSNNVSVPVIEPEQVPVSNNVSVPVIEPEQVPVSDNVSVPVNEPEPEQVPVFTAHTNILIGSDNKPVFFNNADESNNFLLGLDPDSEEWETIEEFTNKPDIKYLEAYNKSTPQNAVDINKYNKIEPSAIDQDNWEILPNKSNPSNVAPNGSDVAGTSGDPNKSSNTVSKGISLLCLVRSRLKTKTKTNKIYPNPNIRKYSNNSQQQPLEGINLDWNGDGIITEFPNLTELNKQILFPLSPLQLDKHKYRKESLLTDNSSAYLNSIHLNPQKFRDVIYEYLKTFSNNINYSNGKKGVLINFNQYIAYNFNKRNQLIRGAEYSESMESLESKINKYLKKTNENHSTNAVPFTFHLEKKPETEKLALAVEVPKPDSKDNINKNININYPLEVPTIVQREKPEIIQLILNRINMLKGVSGETGNNLQGNNRIIQNSYKLLFYFFKSMYCLISKPVFIFTPDKVIIQLNYFINIPKFKVFKLYSIFKFKKIRKQKELVLRINNKNKRFNGDSSNYRKRNKKVHWKVARTLIRLNNKRTETQNILFFLNKYNLFRVFSLKFYLICDILNNIFKKPVELQLIRLHKPSLDSNILLNLLALNIRNKKFKTNVQIAKLLEKKVVKNVYDYMNKSVNSIPTYLSGIKIRIGGRLLREHIIPKISKKRYERGASSVGKVNFLDTASITNKNRKGSYTLKLSLGQNFF